MRRTEGGAGAFRYGDIRAEHTSFAGFLGLSCVFTTLWIVRRDSSSIWISLAAICASVLVAGSARADDEPEPEPDVDAVSCPPISRDATTEVAFDTKVVKSPIPEIDGDAQLLAPLYEKLARVARGSNERVRIAVYGDSNMTTDFITGSMRRELQARFGDGGHGFVAAVRPWPWYQHVDVLHGVTKEGTWRVMATSTAPIKDRLYGFANMAGESGEPNARTWVMTRPESDKDKTLPGTRASSAEIFFLKRPAGGSFSVLVDGQKTEDVVASQRTTEAGFVHATFPDGPHKVEAVVKNGHRVRFFGFALERDVPGIVVDSLGTGALNYEQLGRVEETTRGAMLKERNYDLIIFLLGTNMWAPDMHEKWVKTAIASFRTALPTTPLMLMSPPDVGKNNKDWESDPRIEVMAKLFHDIARSEHLLYWDFWKAMGGKGSMKRFAKNNIALRDFVHLTWKGGGIMGRRFSHELVRSFTAYVSDHPEAGCTEEN